jgi:hypothetical protein
MRQPDRHDRGVLVVGVARSGTSALTAMLTELGLALASPDDVIPPNPLNRLGVYESRTVRRLDQALIARWCSGGWANPDLPPGWHRQLGIRLLHRPARRLFAAVHPRSPWVCKDPQLCLTLPFWRDALEGRALVALIYRHPLAVARSLERGMGFGQPRGLAIWERHLRSALDALVGATAIVVRYDDLVADPGAAAGEIGAWLEQASVPVAGGAVERAGARIGAGERHWRGEDDDAGLVSPAQRELLAALDACRGAHRAFRGPTLGPETPGNAQLFGTSRLTAALRRPRWWWWIAEQTLPAPLADRAGRLRAPRRLRRAGSIVELQE